MRFKQLDLNLFVGLNVLLEEQSITRAARRLHLSQSAASGVLARLREHFKDEILVTIGKTMVLTPFGASLAAPVRSLMGEIQSTVAQRPMVHPRDATRTFRLIASDYIATVLLAEVSRRLLDLAPGVCLETMLPSVACIESFERGEVDLYCTIEDYRLKGVPHAVLLQETFTGLAWTGNTAISGDLSLAQYLSMGHVTAQFAMESRYSYEHTYLESLGYARRVEMSTCNSSSIPQFLIGTNRIATLHRRLATIFASQFPLQVVPLPVEIPTMELCMQWHEFMDQDPLHLWLRQLLLDVARDGELAGPGPSAAIPDRR